MSIVVSTAKNQSMARGKARGKARRHGAKASNQLVTKAQLKRAISSNLEMFKLDTQGQSTISTTADPQSLDDIPVASRNGEVVNLRSTHIRAIFNTTTTLTANATARIRVIVFTWKPDTVPVRSDILENAAVPLSLVSPYKFTNRQFYTIHKDRTYMLSNSAGTNAIRFSFIKKRNRKVRYNDATVPAFSVGLMYWLVFSDQINLADQPIISYNFRQMYTDA